MHILALRSIRWGSFSSVMALPQGEAHSDDAMLEAFGDEGSSSSSRHMRVGPRGTAPGSHAPAASSRAHPTARAAAGEGEFWGRGLLPDATTMRLLHCLFAMAFAALALGGLALVGVVVKTSSSACPPEPGYTACGVWQDFRSIGSFLLGAFVCCVLSHGKEVSMAHAAMVDSAEKVQLYTFML